MLPTSKPRLSQIIQDFKRHTAHEIYNQLASDNRSYIQQILQENKSNKNKDFQLWQRDNRPIIVESDRFFNQKLNYIHENPVKKQYVAKAENWLYSSARNYILGDDSIIRVDVLD